MEYKDLKIKKKLVTLNNYDSFIYIYIYIYIYMREKVEIVNYFTKIN